MILSSSLALYTNVLFWTFYIALVFFVCSTMCVFYSFFFFQAEDGIRDPLVTGVQTCALPISGGESEVLEEEVALHRRRIARLRPGRNRPRERSGGGRREPGGREPHRDAPCRAARGDSPPPTHALRLVSHSPTTR